MVETISDAEVRARIASVPFWYHSIELRPGIVTPGLHPSGSALAILDSIGLPRDARGLRVLDIGCCDGFFAFELERRGADVVAVDYAPKEKTGFGVAAEILGSCIPYVVENVYDLPKAGLGEFDAVLMLGLLYHLRHPLLALDVARAMVRTGGVLFLETLASDVAARDDSGELLPLWRYLPRDTVGSDFTNKWAPNLPGLIAAVEDCEFRVETSLQENDRASVRALAIEDPSLRAARALDWSRGEAASRAGL